MRPDCYTALMLFINLLLGVVSGLLLIIYAKQIADFAGQYVGTSVIRDLNNPWSYRLIGCLELIWVLVTLVLNVSSF